MSGLDGYEMEPEPGPAPAPQRRTTVLQGMKKVLRRTHERAGGDAVEARERDDPRGALQAPAERRQVIEEVSFTPGAFDDGTPIRNRVGGRHHGVPETPQARSQRLYEDPVTRPFPRVVTHLDEAARAVEPGDAKAHIREAMRLLRVMLDHLAKAHDSL